MQHGTFVWNELITRDVENAMAFYARALGWSYEPMTMPKGGTYWLAKTGGKPAGGIVDVRLVAPGSPDSVPAHWFSFIEADDVDARAKAVVEAGGRLMRDIFDVPGVGRIAIVMDAVGAALGLITSVRR